MKLLLMSDTHGETEEMEKVIQRHQDLYEILHAGDSELSFNDPLIKTFKIVRGNCDVDTRIPYEVTMDIYGNKLLLIHGHRHGVKNQYDSIIDYAKQHDAKIACFGHSHIRTVFFVQNCLFINPGSLLFPRSMEKSYAVLVCSPNEVNVQFFSTDTGHLLESNSFKL